MSAKNIYPRVTRTGTTVELYTPIKFRLFPESAQMIAYLRSVNGKQVLHDDHAAPLAATRTVLERLLSGPSDEEGMGLLELSHTGLREDEASVRFAHQAMAEAHVRTLTESHGFAQMVTAA